MSDSTPATAALPPVPSVGRAAGDHGLALHALNVLRAELGGMTYNTIDGVHNNLQVCAQSLDMVELRAPGERLRHAAHLIRNGAAIPVECDRLRSVLAAVLDQEATWADESGDRYPATTAAVLAVADAVNR